MKPSFVIIGATRSGTTTLHDHLSRNPHIFMPKKKELHFFWRDSLYEKGMGFYESFFANATGDQVIGEATPSYLDYGMMEDSNQKHYFNGKDDAAIRLHKAMPDAKIIVSLRNPVKRSYSIFWKAMWGGWETLPGFDEAVEAEISGVRTPQNSRLVYLYRSHYDTHLKHWFDLFPKENIKVMIFEEWTKAPGKAIAEIEDFVGAPLSGLKDEDIQASNQGRSVQSGVMRGLMNHLRKLPIVKPVFKRFSKQGYPPMGPETEERLKSYFKPHVQATEQLLGRDLDLWGIR